MAKCNTCGTEISFFNFDRECDSCAKIRVDQLRAEQAEQTILNEAKAKLIAKQVKLYKNTWIDRQVAEFTSKLSNDAPVYLFQRIYCPVDSRVHDEDLADGFYLEDVEELGADGWQIVGIVPRTIGVGLKTLLMETPAAPHGEPVWGAMSQVYTC